MVTIRDILNHGASPEDTLSALEKYQQDVESQITSNVKDVQKQFQGKSRLGLNIGTAKEELRKQVVGRKIQELFPDEVERNTFLSSSDERGRPSDAYKEQRDQIEAVGAPFRSEKNLYGSIPSPSGDVGRFAARSIGGGKYEVLVKGAKGNFQTKVINTSRDTITNALNQQITDSIAVEDRVKQREEEPGVKQLRELRNLTDKEGPNVFQLQRETLNEKLNFFRKASVPAILQSQLLDDLKEDPEFKDQIPNAWVSQFTARPVVSLTKNLAQAGAFVVDKLTDSEKAKEILLEGDAALERVTPGALRNRFEANGTPIADQLSQGVESAATFLLPTGVAGLAGKALGTAGKSVAGAGKTAGYTNFGATAYGNSISRRYQLAEQAEDPEEADRIRMWAPWLALGDAITEVIVEKALPMDESLLLKGARPGIGSRILTAISTPLNEVGEEVLGGSIRDLYSGTPGSQKEKAADLIEGGFFGGLAFSARAFIGPAQRTNLETGEESEVFDFAGQEYATQAEAQAAADEVQKIYDERVKPAGIETRDQAQAFLDQHNENIRLRQENPDNPDIQPVTDEELNLAADVTRVLSVLPDDAAGTEIRPAPVATSSGANTSISADQQGGIAPVVDQGLTQNPSTPENVNQENIQPQVPDIQAPAEVEAAPVQTASGTVQIEPPPAAVTNAEKIAGIIPNIRYFAPDTTGVEGQVLQAAVEGLGRQVVMYEGNSVGGVRRDGFVISGDPNTIYINRNTKQPFLHVLAHEWAHTLEGSPEYESSIDELQKVEPKAWETASKRFADPAEARREFLSDIAGSRFVEADFWDNAQRRMEPGAFRKFVDFVKGVWDKIKQGISSRGLTVENVEAVDRMLSRFLQTRNPAAEAVVGDVRESSLPEWKPGVYGSGWLKTDGTYMPLVSGETHEMFAQRNGGTSDGFYDKGWVRVTQYGSDAVMANTRVKGGQLTSRQKSALRDSSIETGKISLFDNGTDRTQVIHNPDLGEENDLRFSTVAETQRLGVENAVDPHDPKAVDGAVEKGLTFVAGLNLDQLQSFWKQTPSDKSAADALTAKLLARINNLPGANSTMEEARLLIGQLAINRYVELTGIDGLEKQQLIQRYQEVTKGLTKAAQILRLQRSLTDYLGVGGVRESSLFGLPMTPEEGAKKVETAQENYQNALKVLVPNKAARFQVQLQHPFDDEVIVTLSAKEQGKWQATLLRSEDYGEEKTPAGDARFNTWDEAVRSASGLSVEGNPTPPAGSAAFKPVPNVDLRFSTVAETQRLGVENAVDPHDPKAVDGAVETTLKFFQGLTVPQIQSFFGTSKQDIDAAALLTKRLHGRLNNLPGGNFEIEEVRLLVSQIAINRYVELTGVDGLEKDQLIKRYDEKTKVLTRASQIMRLQRAVTDYLGVGGELFAAVNSGVRKHVGNTVADQIVDASLPTPESIQENNKVAENTIYEVNKEKPASVDKAVSLALAAARKLQALRSGIRQSEIGDDDLARIIRDLESTDPAVQERAAREFNALTEGADIPAPAAEDVARARRAFTDARIKTQPEADALEYQQHLASPYDVPPATPVAVAIQTAIDNWTANGFNAKTAFTDFIRLMKENVVGSDVARSVWPEVRKETEKQIKAKAKATTDAAAGALVDDAETKLKAKRGQKLNAQGNPIVEEVITDLRSADVMPDRDVFIAQFVARFPEASDTTELKLQAGGMWDAVAELKKKAATRLKEKAERLIASIGRPRKDRRPTTEMVTWSKAVNEFIAGKQGSDPTPLEDILRGLKMPEDQLPVVVAMAEMARDARVVEEGKQAAQSFTSTVDALKKAALAREARERQNLENAINRFTGETGGETSMVKAGANDFKSLHDLFVQGGGFDLNTYRQALKDRGLTDEQADKLLAHSQKELENRIAKDLAVDLTRKAKAKNAEVAARLAFEEELTKFIAGNPAAAVKAGGNSFKELHRRFVNGEFTNVETYRQILKNKLKGTPGEAFVETMLDHSQKARAARVAGDAAKSMEKDQRAADLLLKGEIDASKRAVSGAVRPRNPVGALRAYMDKIRKGEVPVPARADFLREVEALTGDTGSLKGGELYAALTEEVSFRSAEDIRDEILSDYRKDHGGSDMRQDDLRRVFVDRLSSAGISLPGAAVEKILSEPPLSSIKNKLSRTVYDKMLRNTTSVKTPAARHAYYRQTLIESGMSPVEADAMLLRKDSKGRTLVEALEAEIARRQGDLIKRVEKASPAARERLQQNAGKVRDTMMAYLMEGDSALTAFAKATGFEMRLTAAEIARFEYLTGKNADAVTETEKAIYTRELNKLVAKVGKNEEWKQILNSLYLASIYSAPSTMAVNVMAPAVQAVTSGVTEAIRLLTYDFKRGGNYISNVGMTISAMVRAFKSGLTEAKFAARSGILAQSIEKMESGYTGLTSIERQSQLNAARLEKLRSKASTTVGEKLEMGKLYVAQLYYLQRMTFRILGMIDSGYGQFFKHFFSQQRKFDLLRKQGLNNKQIRKLMDAPRTTATRVALEAEYRAELGPVAGTQGMARYIEERINKEVNRAILGEGVSEKELNEMEAAAATEARFLLGTNDFNHGEEDLGLIGGLNKGIRWTRHFLDSKVPYLGMAVMGPVTIVGNIANRLVYFTPAGFNRIIQATETVGGKRVVKAPDADGKQRNAFQAGLRYNAQIPQRVIEAWLGSLMFATLGVLRHLQPDDPEDWWFGINLSGPNREPEKSQWLSKGNKPNTIWFKTADGGRITVEISRSAEMFRPAAVVMGMLDQAKATSYEDDDQINQAIKVASWHLVYTYLPTVENLAKFFAQSGPTTKSDVESTTRNQAFTASPIVVPFSGMLNTFNRLADIPQTQGFLPTLLSQIPMVGPILRENGLVDTSLRVNGLGLQPVADRTWYNKLDKLKLFPLSYTKADAEEFGTTEHVLRTLDMYPEPFKIKEVQDRLRKKTKNPSLETSISTAVDMTIQRGKEINERIKARASVLLSQDRERAQKAVREIISNATERQNNRVVREERAK